MASKWPPVKNAAYKFRAALFAQSDDQIKTTPTIATGDFKVSIDGGAFANLGTLPTEEQSGMIEIDLSQAEMNGDEIVVKAVDAAGDEWHSAMWVIHTVAQTLDTIDSNLDTVDTNVDAILVDTGTTIPATISTVDTNVDAILVDTGTTIPAQITGLGSSTITIVSAVDGGDVTVYQYDTWEFTIDLSGSPGLDNYENVIFAAKQNEGLADASSILYVDSANGLVYIGKAAASAASKGSLTVDDADSFTVKIAMDEVATKIADTYSGTYTWWLKGIETGTTPDEGFEIATGEFRIKPGWVRSTS